MGNVEYAPDKGAFIWKIKSFAGGKEFLCRAHFGLPSVKNEDPDKKPPITIKFEIPYFTVSGIQVRYLKVVDKSGYQAFPWVRYITQNGGKFLLTLITFYVYRHSLLGPTSLLKFNKTFSSSFSFFWFFHFSFQNGFLHCGPSKNSQQKQ